MGFSLVLATLLCFTTWMTSVHTTHGPVENCCITTSNTKVRLENIVNYTIQSEGVCPVTAIVFLTKGGPRICSDPKTKWAQRARNKVDKETKALDKGQNEEESTSDTMTPVTPAVSTASIKALQNKSRNGRRRQRKGIRKGRKGQRKCA